MNTKQVTKTTLNTITPIIDLRTKFTLSDKGIGFFSKRGLPYQNLVREDGAKIQGFIANRYKASDIQREIVRQHISHIDVSDGELIYKRQEILESTRQFIYGILYKKFKPSLESILNQSRLAQAIRKKNQLRNPDVFLRFNPETVNQFAISQAQAIRSLKQAILFEPFAIIENDNKLDKSEKENEKQIARHLLDLVDNNTWFLFNYLDKSSDKTLIYRKVSHTLSDFVRKARIADYLALVLMELVQNAERAHLEHLSFRIPLFRKTHMNFDRHLRKIDVRKKLREVAHFYQDFIHLQYHFRQISDELHQNNSHLLVIKLANSGILSEKGQKAIQKKLKAEVSHSITELFEEQSSDLGSGLGLYYLSYLQNACKEEAMKFSSQMSHDPLNSRNEFSLKLQI